jgi:hypothetical protein
MVPLESAQYVIANCVIASPNMKSSVLTILLVPRTLVMASHRPFRLPSCIEMSPFVSGVWSLSKLHITKLLSLTLSS